jgi:hypothetical protein
MRSICRWAVEHGLIAVDPTAALKSGKEYARDRALSDSEIAALWDALGAVRLKSKFDDVRAGASKDPEGSDR